MTNDWKREVLDFWFGELTEADWFAGGTELDAKIVARFGELYERLKADGATNPVDDAHGALAAIIVFDQFPRNMFRGRAEAFATDDIAIEIARQAVDAGLDQALDAQERQFLYMPFMHSEIAADQERCVSLFRALGNEDGLKYAIDHRDIVARFGRFPHRNAALGRDTTRDEREFMEGHAGYGQ